ncbi:MAG: hypothetical protein CML06_06960 [Pseudomonadales bacterium]|nr:hypothetical protein [Pseudomonadales bacterium]
MSLTSPPVASLPPALEETLESILGDRYSTRPAILQQHGRGESHHTPAPPAAVAYVTSSAEVLALARACHRQQTPMIAHGAGTSVEGQLQCVQGGVAVDFSTMNRILAINPGDQDCLVEPGVTREQLNLALRDQGLFFPVDPGANATLGGMAATGASGTTTLRYGGMKANVLALEAVLADGAQIQTGSAARKSSAGYNLTELLIGSEGTLALITGLRLRLHAIPPHVTTAQVGFPSVAQAVAAVIAMLQHGLHPALLELLDSAAMAAVNQYCRTRYPEQPSLFLEFHGTLDATTEQAACAETLCRDQGSTGLQWARQEEDRRRQWHARHQAYYAALAQVPHGQGWVTDVCVPLSRLAQCIEATQADLAAAQLQVPLVGHVGDGNFHLLFSIAPDDIERRAQAEAIHQRLVERAHSLGGTCTGEHGIGLGKKAFLLQEKGATTVAVMTAIKKALDPMNLLNPGKLF